MASISRFAAVEVGIPESVLLELAFGCPELGSEGRMGMELVFRFCLPFCGKEA
jgi:hypothetical protein